MPAEFETTEETEETGGEVEETEILDGANEGTDESEGGADTGDPDPYAEWGGREAVERAIALHKSTQTDEGVADLFYRAGRALGLQDAQINALWGQGGEGEAEGPADDDLITWAQAKELLQKEVIQPFAAQTQKQQETAARASVDTTLKTLGVTDDATASAVLQLGDRYLKGDLSPGNVEAAVRKGHEDFVKLVTANAQKFVASKAATAKRVPKAPAGAAGGGSSEAAQPKSVKEAILQARKKMMAGGL